jgi:hypothetical protein
VSRQISSATRPVRGSTTGVGLPKVSVPASAITWRASQVQPPSKERRSTTSMSPSSAPELRRPSAKARTVVSPVRTTAGIRKVW